jgi:hypothetical protein
MLADKIASKGKSNRGRKAKNAPKKITSILCPECQGTGIHVEGDELEKPTISLSEVQTSECYSSLLLFFNWTCFNYLLC